MIWSNGSGWLLGKLRHYFANKGPSNEGYGFSSAKAETPVLWPPHAKSWVIAKDSDAGRDWGQEEKGTTEDEMAGWHHRVNGREFEWTLGVGDGQGGLACCDSWGRKESDTTEWLKWTELNWSQVKCISLWVHSWDVNCILGRQCECINFCTCLF